MTFPVDLSSRVSHAEIAEYLKLNGWEQQSPGYAGSMWLNSGTRIAVPDVGGFDETSALGIVARIAAFEGRQPSAVARDIFFVRSDITNFRAASSFLLRETISLASAEAMVSSARTMLRSCGTTAVRNRAHIRGNFSKLGDAVASDARMAHTVRGSYIIPIVVPLSDISPTSDLQDALDLGVTRLRPEPFERRVTRTLAQSLRAIADIVVQPAKWPTQNQADSMVEMGVSRELCVAVEQVVAQPDVSEFETSFDWAQAHPSPGARGLSAVSIDSGARRILGETSRLLKKSRVDPDATLTGTIVEFRWIPGDKQGQVAVSTVRHGRPAEVHVSLSRELYDQAWLWHQQMRAVLVEGRVVSERGKPLRIERPSRFTPCESETLFDVDE